MFIIHRYRTQVSSLACLSALVILTTCAREDPGLDQDGWTRYRDQFVAPEGRVVDTANGGISHSEGQGIGMLLAAAFDDRAVFDRLWRWTQKHLQVRTDPLLAWRWDGSPVSAIGDDNNATDGDILVAWALLRAAAQWGEGTYARQGQVILQAIRDKLVFETSHGPVLLPGVRGFVRQGAVVVNPSYWVFPALTEFQRADPQGGWDRIAAAGLRILKRARFGRWGLPADWVLVGENLAIADIKPKRFGHDAIRVPLYLAWDKQTEALAPFVAFWAASRTESRAPAWVDLTHDRFSSGGVSLGQQAVIQLARRAAGRRGAMGPTQMRWRDPEEYYSASLFMLAGLAQREADL